MHNLHKAFSRFAPRLISPSLFALSVGLIVFTVFSGGFRLQAKSPSSVFNPQSTATARPLIVAHRGGAQEFTENTIGAFTRAGKIGADAIETDIRLTSDGVIVVYHDDKVGRVEKIPLTRESKLVTDITYAELTARALPPVGEDRGGQHVPTFKELLAQVRSGLLNVELKRHARFDEMVEQVITTLKGFDALERVVLEAPDLVTAQKLRAGLGEKLQLHINPGYDESVPYEVALKRTLAFKPHSLSVSYKKLSREIVELAHRAGVEVWVWTVNDEEIARAMMILGVDAIKTDQPTKLLALRQQMLSEKATGSARSHE